MTKSKELKRLVGLIVKMTECFDGFDNSSGYCYFCKNHKAFEHVSGCIWEELVGLVVPFDENLVDKTKELVEGVEIDLDERLEEED